MADEGFKVVHRYYITDQKGEINEETPFFDKIDDEPLFACLYCGEKNGKKGIINLKTGKIVLEPIYEVIKKIPSNLVFPRNVLLKWKDSEERTWHGVYELARATGVITRLSETATRTEYELTCQMRKQFYLTQDYDVWPFISSDIEGNLQKVHKNGRTGLMNTETCELVLDFQFGGPNTIWDIDLETLDEEGYVRVHLNTYLEIANIKTGQVQVKKQYSDISAFNKYGLALVYASFEGRKTWGMINRDGEEVIPALNSLDFITLGKPSGTSGYGWRKFGSVCYEHAKYIFEHEESDFLVGFNLQENKWYLYTKTGFSIPYPLKHLDHFYEQQLTSYAKYSKTFLQREILQVDFKPNTFVFPDMHTSGQWPYSNKMQSISLFKGGVIIKTFACVNEASCKYCETPKSIDVIFFRRRHKR